MELKLVLAKGEPKGKVIVIEKNPSLIGRDPECDVVIASPKVSRKHCRIAITGASATVTDLGSGNGTVVNGKKIQTSALSAGDRVAIGPLGFVVEIDGSRGSAASGGASAAADEGGSGDINDFLASLEDKGAAANSSDDDVIQLSEDDLLGGDK